MTGKGEAMKVKKGDLIALARQGEFDVIVHGCNCFNTMGSGIARQIKAQFPPVYAADGRTEKGSRDKLGTCTQAVIPMEGGTDLYVVNAYTQYDYGGPNRNVDYDAVRSCFRWIRKQFSGKRIGFPRIGAGLGGGDWKIISAIIDEELVGTVFTLVEYVPEER